MEDLIYGETASASNGGSGPGISRDVISYDASASDAARNRARVNTFLLLNEFIIDPLNSAAVDNTFIQSLATSGCLPCFSVLAED